MRTSLAIWVFIVLVLNYGHRSGSIKQKAGVKQAQYELGLRFARGEGVPRDCDLARKLFRQPATQSGGTVWV